jgi:hypothetical protein
MKYKPAVENENAKPTPIASDVEAAKLTFNMFVLLVDRQYLDTRLVKACVIMAMWSSIHGESGGTGLLASTRQALSSIVILRYKQYTYGIVNTKNILVMSQSHTCTAAQRWIALSDSYTLDR